MAMSLFSDETQNLRAERERTGKCRFPVGAKVFYIAFM